MYRVFEGQRTFLYPVLRPLERLIYRVSGIQEDEEQTWVRYSASLISLSIFSFLFVYLIQRVQGFLPLNPMHFSTPQAPTGATAMTSDRRPQSQGSNLTFTPRPATFLGGTSTLNGDRWLAFSFFFHCCCALLLARAGTLFVVRSASGWLLESSTAQTEASPISDHLRVVKRKS
jgi:hypothetical protein